LKPARRSLTGVRHNAVPGCPGEADYYLRMYDMKQHPLLWRGYFALCVAVAVLNAIHAFAAPAGQVPPARMLGIAFGFIALCPLYGYVRQRPVKPKALWFAVFAVAIFITAAMLAVAIAHASLQSLLAIPVAALAAPYLYALRQYLYHSAHLWHPERTD
jgi:hypothetical protein